MQGRAELAGNLLVDGVVLGRREQLPEITLADAEGDVAALARELGHVEAVAAERHQRGIALAGLEALEIAGLQHQERSVLVLHDFAALGEMIRTSAGTTRLVMPRKVRMV